MGKFAGHVHLVGVQWELYEDEETHNWCEVHDKPYDPGSGSPVHILGSAQITSRWDTGRRKMISFRVFFDDGFQAIGKGRIRQTFYRIFEARPVKDESSP